MLRKFFTSVLVGMFFISFSISAIDVSARGWWTSSGYSSKSEWREAKRQARWERWQDTYYQTPVVESPPVYYDPVPWEDPLVPSPAPITTPIDSTPAYTPPQNTAWWYVSLVFDDGWTSQYQNAVPILNSAGIRGTFAIMPNYMFDADISANTNLYYINTAQTQNLASMGHEIASHTLSHADLTSLDYVTMADEVVRSRSLLQWAGLWSVTTMIYPYGSYSPSVQDVVRNAWYTTARMVNPGYSASYTDRYALSTQSVNVDTPLWQVQEWINTARANNEWLILTFHQIDYSRSPYSSTPETLQGIVDSIRQVGITPVTVREGATIFYP
jgi:peptidoglycan/xylan/chitin deacetylase (PgdA/CDA1 family)